MLSPLPSSPIYKEFDGTLLMSEPEDLHWLLLPAVFLDKRSDLVRQVIETDSSLFPGFFCFPTPGKAQKREKLQDVFSALEVMIGRAMLDEQIYALWTDENPSLEKELLGAHSSAPAPERIGTGLAIGAFKRIRLKKKAAVPPLERMRAPGVIRERNDGPLRVL
jgi:hypothetical protein